MRQSNYQKIQIEGQERPILFLMWTDAQFETVFHNNFDDFRSMLTELQSKALAAGLNKPYLVILKGRPELGADLARKAGADAIGTYSVPLAPNKFGSFDSMRKQSRLFWSELAATGMPVVPTMMTGFDQRPLLTHPFDPNTKVTGREAIYAAATNNELTDEVSSVVEFVETSNAVPSNVFLVYSWNENSEGGGSLNETLGDPSGKRLEAFRLGLSKRKAIHPPYGQSK